MKNINNLTEGFEGETSEQEGKRIKPAIPILLGENVRVVLASDRKNLMVQIKTDDKEEPETLEEEGNWKTKGYYGTTNWKGVLNKICALYKEAKLTKAEKTNVETLKTTINEECVLIEDWSKKIITTLINNNINL